MHIALDWLRMRTNRVAASRPTSLSNHGLEQYARNIFRLPRYPGVSLENLGMPGFATSLSSYRKWPIPSIMKNFHWFSVRTENRLSAFEADVALFHRSSVVSCPRETTDEPFIQFSIQSGVSWRSSKVGIRRNGTEALIEASRQNSFRSERHPPLHHLPAAQELAQLALGWSPLLQEHRHPRLRWHGHRPLSSVAAFSSSWSGCLVWAC